MLAAANRVARKAKTAFEAGVSCPQRALPLVAVALGGCRRGHSGKLASETSRVEVHVTYRQPSDADVRQCAAGCSRRQIAAAAGWTVDWTGSRQHSSTAALTPPLQSQTCETCHTESVHNDKHTQDLAGVGASAGVGGHGGVSSVGVTASLRNAH